MNLSKKERKILLEQRIEEFKKNGFPKIVASEVMLKLTADKIKIIKKIVDLSQKEKALVKNHNGEIVKGDDVWNVREQICFQFQKAIIAWLMDFGIIQRNVVDYGAIPDPDEGWKYYRLPDRNYACWTCNSGILVKTVSNSVHDGLFPLSGSGEVRRQQVPYCPICDSEPKDGIITESIAESLVNEHEPIRKALEKK